MITKKNYLFALLLPAALFISSCANNTKADEPEIQTMDSVKTNLDKSTKELEDRLKKVEESLAKVEKELEPAK
jgi:septal ring factor EnvC (AmiA/AmiB activator)